MSEFKSILIEKLQALSEELAIDPAFLEKDWYATHALQLLQETTDTTFECIFSGGTCLSKAYHLIKRFSEDLDFRVQGAGISSRLARREFVTRLVKTLEKSKLFSGVDVKKEDQSRRVVLSLTYSHGFLMNQSLRPHLKLELVFRPVLLPIQKKDVNSLLGYYSSDFSNEFPISCISPIETAAEKCSALLWRTVYTDTKDFDPTLMRHLYDLAALKNILVENNTVFKTLLAKIYAEDGKKWKGKYTFASLSEVIENFEKLMTTQAQFQKAYEQFVQNMCYDSFAEELSFKQALKDLKIILADK